MQFLDVKTDYAFKKVFATLENKDILILFLNALVALPSEIVDLEIVDPYNIPMLKGMKDTFVDVKARLKDQSLVIIEMQVLNHDGFEKRVLYNMAKNYATQLTKGEQYHLLNPVIALSIVDFDMFEWNDKVMTHFKLLEKEAYINYSDDIELIFVELPKFTKALHELETIQDKFIYFIKNAGSLELIPDELQELKKAFSTINEANLSKEELEVQYKRKEFISIQKSSITLATTQGFAQGLEEGLEKGMEEGLEKGLEKGMEKGLEKGLEKGRQEERNQLIIDAYRNGTPTTLIASFLNRSEEEIITFLRGVVDL